LLTVLLVVVAAFAGPVWSKEPPTWQMKLEEGSKLLSANKLARAADAFEDADELAAGRCVHCLLGLARALAGLGKWKQAEATVRRVVPLAEESPGLLAQAYVQLAVVLARRRSQEGRAEAMSLLRQASELPGDWAGLARYNMGQLLMLQERWTEAAEEARTYLRETPQGAVAKMARALLCQARIHLPEELPDELEGPKKVGGDVKRPEKIAGRPPNFTQTARMARTQGVVIIEAIIDREGCVRGVRALQGLPDGLTEAAVDAVRTWAFEPATLDGRPVNVYYTLTVNFAR
jgi:TonB family protein